MASSTAIRKPTGRPSRERAAQIDSAIVEATIAAFSESGGDFSMDEVAAAAGISKQAIYRRWTGKIDLIIHAIAFELQRTEEVIGKALPRYPLSALREVAWRMFNTDRNRQSRFGIFLQAEGLRDAQLRENLMMTYDRRLAWLEQFIAPVRVGADDDAPTLRELAEILLDLTYAARSALEWRGDLSATTKRRIFERRWLAFTMLLNSRQRGE